MSSDPKLKHQHFGSDVRRLLFAAEAAQKTNILTSSSSHLGPHNLNLLPKETEPRFWEPSRRKEESLKEGQGQTLGCVRKKENTSGAAFVESEVLRSKRDQARDYSSHAGTREDTSPTEAAYCSSNPLSQTLKDASQKESNCSSVQANLQFSLNDSFHETLDAEGQLDVKLKDVRQGVKVAEVFERKLQNELKKLSALSWPSRDRLAVFSDVFDDVCEGSPVFGRILREIKTEYDLYINHLMDSHSSKDNVSLQALDKDIDEITISDKEVEGAEKEVCRLEEEARRALEENKRVQAELKNLPAVISREYSSMKNTSLSRNEDSGTAIDDTNRRLRRLQVLNVLEEIQQLEEEIHKGLASAVAAAASERRIKDLKAETIRLIASNDRQRTINKNLQKNISLVLDREKPRKAITQMLWSEIDRDLQTNGE